MNKAQKEQTAKRRAWEILKEKKEVTAKSSAALARKLDVDKVTLHYWFNGIGTPEWLKLEEKEFKASIDE